MLESATYMRPVHRKTGRDHGVNRPRGFGAEAQAPPDRRDRAFEDCDGHPAWPTVADTVIEADGFPSAAVEKVTLFAVFYKQKFTDIIIYFLCFININCL
jgi:hypothetical protein